MPGFEEQPNDFYNICYSDSKLFAHSALKTAEIIFANLKLDMPEYIENKKLITRLGIEKAPRKKVRSKLINHLKGTGYFIGSKISEEVERFLDM